MRKHTVVCEWCGHEAEMVLRDGCSLYTPVGGWEEISGRDVCPACVKVVEKKRKELASARIKQVLPWRASS